MHACATMHLCVYVCACARVSLCGLRADAHACVCHYASVCVIIIIKKISRAPIYHTRWQHRALYNNTNHTHARAHTHTRARAHTHTVSDEGMGRAVKNSY